MGKGLFLIVGQRCVVFGRPAKTIYGFYQKMLFDKVLKVNCLKYIFIKNN